MRLIAVVLVAVTGLVLCAGDASAFGRNNSTIIRRSNVVLGGGVPVGAGVGHAAFFTPRISNVGYNYFQSRGVNLNIGAGYGVGTGLGYGVGGGCVNPGAGVGYGVGAGISAPVFVGFDPFGRAVYH